MYAATFTGSSYSPNNDESTIEMHADLEEAVESLMDRYVSNGSRTVDLDFLDGHSESVLMPSVDEGDTLTLYSTEYDTAQPSEEGMLEVLTAVHNGHSDYRLILTIERAGEMDILITRH